MSNTATEHRQAAEDRINELSALLQQQPKGEVRDRLLDECAALARAIAAFHMEGIRFRMFNVDRMINRGAVIVADDARESFAEVRRQLEAAGFHTRSHQAPS